ncbi:hypothetical protein WJX81_007158 [Elliptochloris bilobata]|uniref:Uncharacterized protein n=1 Tax=Elliptochloris bilobata TaxID=381761 RepID=A0AAW1S2M0_9CHLO
MWQPARIFQVKDKGAAEREHLSPRPSRARQQPKWAEPCARGEDGGAGARGSGTAVKMGRREAWARFLAYEGCWQVCLKASGEGGGEPAPFLADGCAVLRAAFKFDGLLLRPAGPNTPACGATLVWDDSEPAALAALPAVGYGQQTTRAAVVKAVPARLQCAALYRPWAVRVGLCTALPPPQLYVSLRPHSWQEDGVWTVMSEDGRGGMSDAVAMGADEGADQLDVEVHSGDGLIARGSVSVADLWAAAGNNGSTGPPDPDSPAAPGAVGGGLLRCCACTPAGGGEDDVFGKKWVAVYDATGAGLRYGHVLLSTWIADQERTVLTGAEAAPALGDEASGAAGHGGTSTTFNQVTSWQVYDLSLDAALRAQGCGPRQLTVEGEWAWLLGAFAGTYGLRPSYTVLAHLRWVMRPENATVTAYCLDLLGNQLGPLKQAEAAGRLAPQELALLAALEQACEALLARCFENYAQLAEGAPSGILEGGQAAPELPAPALLPAVELCNILRDALKPVDQVWLADRFRVAAVRRYGRLEGACDDQLPFSSARQRQARQATADARRPPAYGGPLGETAPPYEGEGGGGEAEVAYARLEALCQAIKAELGNDLKIHDAAVLPAFIMLPQVTAAEYGRLFVAKLTDVLGQYPPPQPSRPAVDLLVAVGQQQEYLLFHNLLPPPGHPGALDALQVFGPHVTRWINGSQAALCARCRQLEQAAGGFVGHAERLPDGADGRTFVAPLVEEMLARIGSEVGRYERVVTYWPVFGPLLEGAVCAALREATGAVSRQCGLAHVRDGGATERGGAYGAAGPYHQRRESGSTRLFGAEERERSPSRWRWTPAVAAVGQARLTVLPHEAVLLNSLRRLLAVVPQTEHTLNRWAGGPAPPGGTSLPSPAAGGREAAGAGTEVLPGGGTGPQLGAQFAQLVKELRSEYGGAVSAAAARISGALFAAPGRSILRILEQHGVTGTPALMQQQTGPVLEAMEEVVVGLTRSLDSRVYVALGRGLWDFTAKEIFDYVEGLQEGKENPGAWRGRQNAAAALDVVDNFFTGVLSGTLQHALQDKDLDLPLHSGRAHALLAANTAAINMSYTVY